MLFAKSTVILYHLSDTNAIGITVAAAPSYIHGDVQLYGTGTVITVLDNEGKDIGDFTLIVEGDLNGDSVCDVMDASEAYLYSAGFKEPTENEIYAANGYDSEEITPVSYQNVVNRSLMN